MTNNQAFIETVYAYYKNNNRDLPWRKIDNEQFAYHVFISEMMLQQTQVSRVIEKFNSWIGLFPTIDSVANATLAEVMTAWSGLGYNRRAQYVLKAMVHIQRQHNSSIPDSIDALVALPGIGHNTAAAILVYAYNQPHAFIETNIRTVYLHHYFKEQNNISDKDIIQKVQETLDVVNPRDWYWALMDYGTYLKKQRTVSISNSRAYKKQSEFAGSIRQIRGRVIATLVVGPKTPKELSVAVNGDDRLLPVLDTLINEGLVAKNQGCYKIADE